MLFLFFCLAICVVLLCKSMVFLCCSMAFEWFVYIYIYIISCFPMSLFRVLFSVVFPWICHVFLFFLVVVFFLGFSLFLLTAVYGLVLTVEKCYFKAPKLTKTSPIGLHILLRSYLTF